MKKSVFFKSVLFSLVLSNTSSLLAASISESNNKKNVTTTTNIKSKNEFIASFEEINPTNIIHNGVFTLEKWREKDLIYLKDKKYQNLEQELNILRKELEKQYTTPIELENGTKIYGYSKTEWIDTLISSIILRTQLLNNKEAIYSDKTAYIGSGKYNIYSKTSNTNPFKSDIDLIVDDLLGEINSTNQNDQSNSNKTNNNMVELDALTESLYEVLYEYNLPEKLVSNLNIYLTPYHLEGYLGFTYTQSLKGREEEIVIARSVNGGSKQEILDTILHELGHVFYYDVIGAAKSGTISPESTYNIELNTKLKDGIDKTEVMKSYAQELGHLTIYTNEVSEGYLTECFAEHFREYFLRLNKKEILKSSPYPHYEHIDKLIANELKKYDPYIERSMPTVLINNFSMIESDFGSFPYETFKAGKVKFKIFANSFDNKIPVYYDLLMKDPETNTPVIIFENKGIQNGVAETYDLKKGEYAILIHTKDSLLKFNDFFIK